MKSPKTLLIAAVLALVVAAFLSRSTAQSTTAPAGPAVTRVAVCDVAAVFNNYQRVKGLNAQFSQKRKAIVAKDELRRQELRRIEEMLEALRPGSKEYEAKVAEFEKLSLERSVWRKLQEQTVIRQHRRLTEQMYGKILDAIAEVAKEQNYDVVIYRENVPIASQTTTELLNKIAQRKCLYYNPSIDLTDVVLQRVNRQYSSSSRPK